MYVRYRVKIGRDVEGGGGGGGSNLRCASLHEHFQFYTFPF